MRKTKREKERNRLRSVEGELIRRRLMREKDTGLPWAERESDSDWKGTPRGRKETA
jgi:hypothetical protein